VWRDIGVREESGGDGCEGDEEIWAEVCAQTGYEAGGCGEGDRFFNVEVETV
jgi:hypothetical protein